MIIKLSIFFLTPGKLYVVQGCPLNIVCSDSCVLTGDQDADRGGGAVLAVLGAQDSYGDMHQLRAAPVQPGKFAQ